MLATAESLRSLAAREQRGGRLSTAAILIGPATIFVTIGLLLPILLLFRYSLNAFVPGKLMVEALTPENYVLFVTDPYYLVAFTRTLSTTASSCSDRTSWSCRRIEDARGVPVSPSPGRLVQLAHQPPQTGRSARARRAHAAPGSSRQQASRRAPPAGRRAR